MSRNNITGDEIKSRILSKQGRENWDHIFAKKSATQWAKENGLIIYDNDGFDCLDTPITYKEYKRGINHCTVFGAIKL